MKKGEKNKSDGRGFFEFDGNFYTYTGKIFDIILASIYWLVGCLPVITIGASFAALHAAVTKSVRQDRDTVTKQFWRSYCRNFIPSIPLTLIYGGTIFLFLLNIGILNALSSGLAGLFFMVLYAVAGLFVLICACYGFPALSRFEMPTGWFVKLSAYMAVRHLPISLLLLILLMASYFSIFSMPVAVVFIPGASASVASMILEPLLNRHMPEEEKIS